MIALLHNENSKSMKPLDNKAFNVDNALYKKDKEDVTTCCPFCWLEQLGKQVKGLCLQSMEFLVIYYFLFSLDRIGSWESGNILKNSCKTCQTFSEFGLLV